MADQKPFFIVDFDRTTADSDKLLEVFLSVVDQYLDLPREQIEAADADVKARGDSFDTASYVRNYLADHDEVGKWDQLTKQFIHESRSLNMLMPGASELLQYLDQNKIKYGILTYGNPLWQHLKLSAAGFNHVRRIVMTTKEKGRLIAGWQQPDGSFILPHELGGGTVGSVVMIDDKAVSFEGFPGQPSEGFWVLDPAHELISQQGAVPDNVTRFRNLAETLEYLISPKYQPYS